MTTKKCPFCYTYLQVQANRCDVCGKRVGEVDDTGWARKPIDFKGYLTAAAACGACAWFIWWAFLAK
ncbi:MAG: hypothetical protein ACOWWM_07740 [Desulfobacterales bacterium]